MSSLRIARVEMTCQSYLQEDITGGTVLIKTHRWVRKSYKMLHELPHI